MIFAINGSQSCGKTTLLKKLNEQGYNVIETQSARKVLNTLNVPLSDVISKPDVTKEFQDLVLEQKYQDEKEYIESNDIFLTERTYIDLFVYSLISLGKLNKYSNWLNDYYTKCIKLNSIYSGVFFLKNSPSLIEDDGVRSINIHYSDMTDLLMEHYSKKTFKNFIIINELDLNMRYNYVIQNINFITT